jgi:hypothetical protein
MYTPKTLRRPMSKTMPERSAPPRAAASSV